MSKNDGASSNGGETKLSCASVQRFSLYLRHLERWNQESTFVVSSSQLGEVLGINDAQVRKDLAYLGNLGQPGIGYQTQELIAALRHRLGVDHAWSAIVLGAGNLARGAFALSWLRPARLQVCRPVRRRPAQNRPGS